MNSSLRGILAQLEAVLSYRQEVKNMIYTPKTKLALKGNPVAKAVKLADLKHNSDLSRLDAVDENALRRREKYLKAITLLEE